jgi:hypothetical protein
MTDDLEVSGLGVIGAGYYYYYYYYYGFTGLCWILAAFSVDWTGEQPVARLLPTHRTIQTQNRRTQ